MGLFTFILSFLLIGAYVADISTDSNKFCDCNDYGFSIKLTNEQDLRFKLEEKVTSILMKNQLRDITIVTYITRVDDLNPATPVPVSFSIREETMVPNKFPTSSVRVGKQQTSITNHPTKTISVTPTMKVMSNPATNTQNITDENDLTDNKTVLNSTDEMHKDDGTVYVHNPTSTYGSSTNRPNDETTSITYENLTSKIQTTVKSTSDTINTAVSTLIPDEETQDRATVTPNTVKATEASNLRDTTIGNSVESSGFEISTTFITQSETTKSFDTTIRIDQQCEYEFESICYWTVVNPTQTLNYEEAIKMCNSKDSALALIPNSQVYNIITTMIRSKIPAHVENVRIWTKLQIDPLTGDTISANAYTMWLPNRPATSEDNVDKTHVYLVINRDPTSTGQGMANMSPQKEIHGVACQLQVNEAIEARSLTTQKITSSFEGLQLTNTIVMAGNQHTMHTSIEKVVISTEKPILDESTTGKSVDFRGDPTCEYQFESICYWTDVHDFKMINYSQAQEKCLERNSTLASIANDEVYNNIINLLRSKVTSGQNMFFWIELQIEPLTNVTTPANAYTRWFPNLSYLGGRRIDSTHVYLALNRDPVFSNQGMVNNKPETLNNGMVCQFQKN